MRHRNKGRKLGRHPNHQRALLRNLAAALILTERETEPDEVGAPKVKGRIITTLPKAKEVRPLVERCVTIARRTLRQQEAADELRPEAERHSQAWRTWRESPQWLEWNQAIAPVISARRRVLKLLGDKRAMAILFEDIAPRFADRPGGYTRILRLAKPRLGDAGPRAILEFVGTRDRVSKKAPKPIFEAEPEPERPPEPTPEPAPEPQAAAPAAEEQPS